LSVQNYTPASPLQEAMNLREDGGKLVDVVNRRGLSVAFATRTNFLKAKRLYIDLESFHGKAL
jgi:hypothetical protein